MKCVLIICSELSQRWLDYYYLDELSHRFDFEYWDCSDIVIPGFHFAEKPYRNYVKKISSLEDLEANLKLLPKNTLMIHGAIQHIRANYKFHKCVSRYFPNMSVIGFDSNLGDSSNKSERVFRENISKISWVKQVKSFLYKSELLQLCIKYCSHWDKNERKRIIDGYYAKKIWELYSTFNVIDCTPRCEMHINHPDVEKFLKIKDKANSNKEQYIVFIDEYFPLHPDLAFVYPETDMRSLAEPYYKSMNQLFEQIETQYDCDVIIAAHPNSNYTDNPYGGRTIIKHKTAELIRDSMAVCTHAGNAISYVMLFNKPINLVINNALRVTTGFSNLIQNTGNQWGIQIIDADNLPDKIKFQEVNAIKREEYITSYFGEINDNLQSNRELIPMHLETIYHKLYG